MTGSFFEGFVELSKELNIPLTYAAVFADQGHQEWFQNFFLEELTSKFQEGDLVVANCARTRVGNKRAVN